MERSRIACRVQSYAPFESRAFEHLASLGVRHVEIPVPPADGISATVAELRRFGLSATTLHGECDVQRADIAAQVEAQMPACAALGVRILFVAVKSGDVPLEVAYARLREAAGVAARQGVTVALETHPDLVTNAETARTTLRGVDHPNLCINYDTANIYFYNQGADGVAELRRIVDRVCSLHLKDTDGGYRHWYFPALGRGVVRFAELFRVLDDAGFDGPCTLEIEGVEGESRSERLVCDRIAESLGYLRGLGRC